MNENCDSNIPDCDCNISENMIGVTGGCLTKSRYCCNNGGFPRNMLLPPPVKLELIKSGKKIHVKEDFSIMGAVYPGRDALCGYVPGAT